MADSYWQATGQIDAAFMHQPCNVWFWEGDDFLLKDYVVDQGRAAREEANRAKAGE